MASYTVCWYIEYGMFILYAVCNVSLITVSWITGLKKIFFFSGIAHQGKFLVSVTYSDSKTEFWLCIYSVVLAFKIALLKLFLRWFHDKTSHILCKQMQTCFQGSQQPVTDDIAFQGSRLLNITQSILICLSDIRYCSGSYGWSEYCN